MRRARQAEVDVETLRLTQEIALQRAVDAIIDSLENHSTEQQERNTHRGLRRLAIDRMKRMLGRTSMSVDVARVHVQLADRDFDGGLLLGGLRIFRENAAVPESNLKKRTKRTSVRRLSQQDFGSYCGLLLAMELATLKYVSVLRPHQYY